MLTMTGISSMSLFGLKSTKKDKMDKDTGETRRKRVMQSRKTMEIKLEIALSPGLALCTQ